MAEKQQTEAEVIQTYGKLLEEANAGVDRAAVAAATGACVYSAGSGTYCASLTKAQCDQLRGAWTEGGRCP